MYNLPWLKAQRFFPRSAWKFFSTVVLLVSVIYLVPELFKYPAQLRVIKNIVQEIPEFEGKFENGRLNISKVKQPFFHKINEELVLVADSVGTQVDPVANFVTSSKISAILITADRLEYRNAKTGENRIQKWDNMPDYTVTKSTLQKNVELMSGPIAVIIFFVVLLLIYVGVFISKLYSVLLVSFIVSPIGRIFGRVWKWKELFTLTLMSITLPSLIELLSTLTRVEFQYIHFIALLAFVLAVVFTNDGQVEEDGRVV